MAEKKRLTEDGLKKIEQEIENLKTVRRNEIAEKIWFAFIEKPTNYNDWESNELVVVECLYIVQES